MIRLYPSVVLNWKRKTLPTTNGKMESLENGSMSYVTNTKRDLYMYRQGDFTVRQDLREPKGTFNCLVGFVYRQGDFTVRQDLRESKGTSNCLVGFVNRQGDFTLRQDLRQCKGTFNCLVGFVKTNTQALVTFLAGSVNNQVDLGFSGFVNKSSGLAFLLHL